MIKTVQRKGPLWRNTIPPVEETSGLSGSLQQWAFVSSFQPAGSCRGLRAQMQVHIAHARDAGVVPLAYEGGIEIYPSYTGAGLEELIENQLTAWMEDGGGLFLYYSLAGNVGSGLIPDLTRRDPAHWPKLKAIHDLWKAGP